MTKQELEKFFNYLKRGWMVVGPTEIKESEDFFSNKISVQEIDSFDELYLGPQLPFFSFKRFFVPENETLFEYSGVEVKSPRAVGIAFGDARPAPLYERGEPDEHVAIFGMNILDLKSILLYDQVFEKDPYYQRRRQKRLVIGHSLIPAADQNIFEQTFEEDILEHLSFDIFLGAITNNQKTITKQELAVFTGSLLGQKVLENFGYHEYIHIQFSGPVKEGKLDERTLKIQDKLKNHHNQKIWDELGKRCIECGKCTVACPTCFCFRIEDRPSLEQGEGQRQRCWDSCYYQEFSEVSGGHKFLNSTAARIHFWYYHKFGRIPDEFNFMGCIGCKRCAAVCPVGIDIAEVLNSIEES